MKVHCENPCAVKRDCCGRRADRYRRRRIVMAATLSALVAIIALLILIGEVSNTAQTVRSMAGIRGDSKWEGDADAVASILFPLDGFEVMGVDRERGVLGLRLGNTAPEQAEEEVKSRFQQAGWTFIEAAGFKGSQSFVREREGVPIYALVLFQRSAKATSVTIRWY